MAETTRLDHTKTTLVIDNVLLVFSMYCSKRAYLDFSGSAFRGCVRYLLWFCLITYPSTLMALVISSNPINGNQRATIQTLVNDFQRLHPQIKTSLLVSEHESYKKKIDQSLTQSPTDIYFWFGGTRLRQLAESGKILKLDDLWQRNGWSDTFTQSSKSAVSFQGHTYGLPLYYYQWGLYYRQSLFTKLRLTAPTTWTELEEVASQLLAKNITPFTLGSKDHWPVAGWFDYLNLRINGLDFHQELLAGKVSFLDNRVRSVFLLWQSMLDRNYFIEDHPTNDWRGALPYLYHEKAAMVLMGNFFLSTVPESLLKDFRFIPFPIINPEVPRYEEAPIDILMVSAKTTKLAEVELFLRFIAQTDNQETLARTMEMIPTNLHSVASDDINIQRGAELLKSAVGLSQFFDRDTPPEFAEPAMAVLAEFVAGKTSAAESQRQLDALSRRHLQKMKP